MTGIERMNLSLAVEFINNGFEGMTDAGKTVFASTCVELGIEVNEPITSDEFERLSGIIVKMVGDNAMDEVVASKEVTLGEKARKFAEASKEKLEKGLEFAVENIESVKDEVVSMANMSPEVLEEYLMANGKKKVKKLMDIIREQATKERDNAKAFPFFADASVKNAEKYESLLSLVKAIMDDDNKSGWGKFVSIVKEIAKWVLKVLLKVGAIVLKIALTVVVGAIKIGAATLVTAGNIVNVTYKEVFKPVFNEGKKVWNKAKEKIDEVKAAKFDDFDDDFEDDFFEDEELYVVDEQ